MKKHKIVCYTSFTFSYLGKASLLAWSLKRFHPDWYFIAVITDKFPSESFNSDSLNYFDEIIWSCDLPIENFDSWIFKHDIVEACTAVKGTALRFIFEKFRPEKLLYFDPDIAVFNPLDEIILKLNDHNIILTPHQLQPDKELQGIIDNEIGSLKYGIYNLGFVAINNSDEAFKFARWWEERLLQFCYDDIPNGLFTDQKWCNHVPVFFENVFVMKDPGYNVASWNLSNRKLAFNSDGMLEVNGSLIRFYHFTKLGPTGETMTSRYAQDNIEVYELWEWYKYRLVKILNGTTIPSDWWHYNSFTNGERISKEMRVLYRNRTDLQTHFSNPFDGEGYSRWYKSNFAVK